MIKLALSRNKILSALDKVRSTVSSSQTVMSLQCFCFRDGKVITFNGRSGTVTNLDLGGASFCVMADKFYRLMSSLYEEINFTFNPATGKIKLKSGSNSTDLNTISSADFPNPFKSDLELWSNSSNLTYCLNKIIFNCYQLATKPELMGIGIKDSWCYTSDLKRLSRVKLDCSVPTPLTIPGDSAEHIIKLGNPNALYRNSSNLQAVYADGTIYTTVLQRDGFPFDSCNTVFNNCTGNQVYVLPEGIQAAIDRVVLMAANSEPAIILTNTGNGLEITTESSDGSGYELLPWAYPHKFVLKCNPKYLQEAWASTTRVDLTEVTSGNSRLLRFFDERGFDHILALMA